MTTLVALATKDALVLGCDSLGTRTKRLVDPMDLINFFDIDDKEFKLKLEDGKPLLKSFFDISRKSISIPSEHMTHMTKLFSLESLKAGVMLTGATSIGNRTIKSLIEEFRAEKIPVVIKNNYSIEDVARELTAYILKYYRKTTRKKINWPELELIIGGYGKGEPLPKIYRIRLPEREVKLQLKGGSGIVFGGQMQEIQRIVFGTDYGNRLNLKARHIELIRKYREKINSALKKDSINFKNTRAYQR